MDKGQKDSLKINYWQRPKTFSNLIFIIPWRVPAMIAA